MAPRESNVHARFDVLYLRKNNLDILALFFVLFGVFLIMFSKTASITNLGWVFFVIGVVKQLIEWR